ncbi:MAG: hypothetical protein KAX18_02065 [Candidatus Lokiarchaeota archaeon]|nr:hypothetical protein [Candidatus Lokiarchaeota archaeon]MCK4383436.1 hypothetical protein [Candidatus Lokiarchaeota archaeon]
METENTEEVVRKITKIILTNPQKMIREEDLKNLSKELNFDIIMSEIYVNLQNIGFELIKTTFLEQKFYILTSGGKDDNITPSQYGTLALIIALSKEVDENLKIEDLKEIFDEIWDTNIQFLIDNDYLRKFEEIGIIKVAPLGKAIMKNVIGNIQLKNLLELFKE